MIKGDKISALDAKFEAQKIAFAPVVFQVTIVLRNKGILSYLQKCNSEVDIPTISEALNISEYGLKVLLEIASTSGIVNRNDKGCYSLTKTGYFLESDELTKVNLDFIQDVCYKGLFHLQEAIDSGSPSGLIELGNWPTIYEGLSALDSKTQASWFGFDHFYSNNSFPDALKIIFDHKPNTLLDVGGNTGLFSIKCCEFDPKVSVTIVDLPGQLAMAEKNIANQGFKNRIDYFPINLLNPDKELPSTDAIWMSQFLDCFSEKEIASILKHVIKSMLPETKLFIMETFWDIQDFPAATFSLAATSVYFTALANGNSKMYGREEFLGIIREAGLEVIDEVYPVGISHSIITCQLPNKNNH